MSVVSIFYKLIKKRSTGPDIGSSDTLEAMVRTGYGETRGIANNSRERRLAISAVLYCTVV